MQFKLKALAAAVAFVAAGSANAALTAPSTTTGSSVLFEAWTSTQTFIFDIGNTFSTYGTTATAAASQATGDSAYSLGSSFTSAFGSLGSGFNWMVVSAKSNVAPTGMELTSQVKTGYTAYNNNAGNALVSSTPTQIATISNANGGALGLVANTDAASFQSTWGNIANFNSLASALGGAASGFFTGPIDASTAYTPTAGVAYFTQSLANGGGAAQTLKTAFASSAGDAANWILQSDGTLTYHVASAPASVPLPAALWLFASGLLGLVGIGRRKLAAA